MASEIKVNTIKDLGGNTIVSSNGSGTFTSNLPSTTLTGSTNNQVTTVTGANAITGETNLIYDQTRLGVGANGSSADLGVGLHIKTADSGASVNSDADQLVIEGSTGATGMSILSATNGTGDIYFGDSGNNAAGFIQYNHSSNYMRFGTNAATEQMRVDSSGNVGIGGTAPLGKLHVKTGSQAGSPNVDADADELVLESNGNCGLNILCPQANTGSIAFSDDGDADVGIIEYAHNGNSMRFTTNGAERVRFTGDSRVGIGCIPDGSFLHLTGGSEGSYLMKFKANNNTHQTHYMMAFTNNSGSIVGEIRTNNNNATSYLTSSDYRLKENVDYNFDATTRLKQLKPARFNFISDDTNTLVDGFIAHEVSSVIPEAISGDKDAMIPEVLYTADDELPEGKEIGDVKEVAKPNHQGIDQSKLVPLLTKALQEAITKIETLETKVTALENA